MSQNFLDELNFDPDTKDSGRHSISSYYPRSGSLPTTRSSPQSQTPSGWPPMSLRRCCRRLGFESQVIISWFRH